MPLQSMIATDRQIRLISGLDQWVSCELRGPITDQADANDYMLGFLYADLAYSVRSQMLDKQIYLIFKIIFYDGKLQSVYEE